MRTVMVVLLLLHCLGAEAQTKVSGTLTASSNEESGNTSMLLTTCLTPLILATRFSASLRVLGLTTCPYKMTVLPSIL